MIKLMHVIYGLNTGGAETLVKDYALKIDKSKFDLTILCLTKKNSPYDLLLKDRNINVIYVSDYQKYINKKGVLFSLFNSIQRYFLVRKFIHKIRPDIIHSHLQINPYIKFSKPVKGTKLFYTIHSDPERYWPNKKGKDYKVTNYLVKKYNMRFICLHEEMIKKVNEMFGVNNSLILNNGIDFNRFDEKNVKDKSIIKNNLNIPQDSFVIGHVGRFIYEKNHTFLIDIFSQIYSKNKKAYLLMIGDGNKKDEIISKIESLHLEKRCLILSKRSDIPDLLKIMDCFVFPSIIEGLPVTLIEAQKMKLPCFVSDSISKYVTISNLITWLSLSESDEKWANMILDYKTPDIVKLNDKDWDINNVIKRLENIYFGNL